MILSKTFEEIDQMTEKENQESGVQAIRLAKANARGQMNFVNARPTCRASLVIGEGEGRATSEFEIIRWLNMYTQANTLRGEISRLASMLVKRSYEIKTNNFRSA